MKDKCEYLIITSIVVFILIVISKLIMKTKILSKESNINVVIRYFSYYTITMLIIFTLANLNNSVIINIENTLFYIIFPLMLISNQSKNKRDTIEKFTQYVIILFSLVSMYYIMIKINNYSLLLNNSIFNTVNLLLYKIQILIGKLAFVIFFSLGFVFQLKKQIEEILNKEKQEKLEESQDVN